MKTGICALVLLVDVLCEGFDAGLDAPLADHQFEGVTVDLQILRHASMCSPVGTVAAARSVVLSVILNRVVDAQIRTPRRSCRPPWSATEYRCLSCAGIPASTKKSLSFFRRRMPSGMNASPRLPRPQLSIPSARSGPHPHTHPAGRGRASYIARSPVSQMNRPPRTATRDVAFDRQRVRRCVRQPSDPECRVDPARPPIRSARDDRAPVRAVHSDKHLPDRLEAGARSCCQCAGPRRSSLTGRRRDGGERRESGRSTSSPVRRVRGLSRPVRAMSVTNVSTSRNRADVRRTVCATSGWIRSRTTGRMWWRMMFRV